MNVDVDTLKDAIAKAAREGPLADAITGVNVEPDRDDDGEDFLRVQLTVHLPEGDVDDQLVNLIERIEESIASVDHRYPDIRFLDAA